MARQPMRLRNLWRRTFKPSVDDCEREIISAWFDLCSIESKPVPSIEREARALRVARTSAVWRLNDFAIFRMRAMKREAVAP